MGQRWTPHLYDRRLALSETLTIWRPEPALNTRIVEFASDGYSVIPELICEQELTFARELVTELVDR